MACALTAHTVITYRPRAERRVITIDAADADDAADRVYRMHDLDDDEIVISSRPAAARSAPDLTCGAPQHDGTVVTISMSAQQRRQLVRWLLISAALPMAAMSIIHWLAR